MIGKLTTVVTGIISHSQQQIKTPLGNREDPTASAARSAPDNATEDPDSSLYQCSECGSVYVALDKDDCSRCNTTVTEVSSTLSST